MLKIYQKYSNQNQKDKLMQLLEPPTQEDKKVENPVIREQFSVYIYLVQFLCLKLLRNKRYNFKMQESEKKGTLSLYGFKNNRVDLASTNCSVDIEDCDKSEKLVSQNKGKKRIGPYSYYLKNIIGSGYGGRVYKGIRDNNKTVWYAIKIIKLKDMNLANIYLLNSEIAIIQQLEHPNIIKFVDVYYTQNHCYLITEYCEGGNLEKYIKCKENVEWGTIIYQISQGCQYLANKNIVHRDLKPANIFLKNGVWKIGDFGFSKKISHSAVLIIQSIKVGSPLFMPLQTLQRNMYSIKSDSFAFGVMIYYLIFKEYPFAGKDVPSLIKSLKEKELDVSKLDHLSLQIMAIIKGLCANDMRDRLQISDIDFTTFLTHKSLEEIEEGLASMADKVVDQVTLCQFINYLMKNSVNFLQDDHILYSLMSSNLYHLITAFKWENKKCLNQIKKTYILPNACIKITDQLYKKIMNALESQINILKFRKDSLLCQVALQKLLEYYQIVRCILQADIKSLLSILNSITLHQTFLYLNPNIMRIQQLLPLIANQ